MPHGAVQYSAVQSRKIYINFTSNWPSKMYTSDVIPVVTKTDDMKGSIDNLFLDDLSRFSALSATTCLFSSV